MVITITEEDLKFLSETDRANLLVIEECIRQAKETKPTLKESQMVKVLDHGYVKLLNVSGAIHRNKEMGEYYDPRQPEFSARDTDPAKSARICFAGQDIERTNEQDMKLVEYLMANGHNSPIEMTEVWLEMKLPIFLARQFVRHRTATINETSARYSILPDEFYIPDIVRGKGGSNKQGSVDNLLPELQREFKVRLRSQCESSYSEYLNFLELGVAPEVARNFLHVNHYTHWVWKQDLHNLMHFLRCRLDNHAQWEAREYAQAIYTLLEGQLPETMRLFTKYRQGV